MLIDWSFDSYLEAAYVWNMQWSLSNHALATATTRWKKQWLNYYAKQHLCTCSTLLFISFPCLYDKHVKRNVTFTKNVNTPQRIFPVLSELMTVGYKILGNHSFFLHTYMRFIESPFTALFGHNFLICARDWARLLLTDFLYQKQTSKLIFSDFLTSESLLDVRKV